MSLSRCEFIDCDFTDTDLSESNCEDTVFSNCKLVGTNMYRTNCKGVTFGGSDFSPSDCFGLTITMTCRTFQGMRMKKLWWLAFLFFFTTIEVIDHEKESLVEKLIGSVYGSERYVKLKALFQRREL